MKLNALEVKGFSSYKDHVRVSIPFGITGITGIIDNAEGRSNGAGKSSLLMSLPFALFGVGTFDKMEEVWNDKLASTDDAFVKADFDLMGNNYVIERGRKKKASYLDVYENGKRVRDGNTESQEFINELLGMDSKMFLSSVFVAQKDLAAFIETDPSVRKSYMDVVTNLTLWRDALKGTNSLYKESKAKFDIIVEEVREIDKKIIENETIKRSLQYEVQNLNSVRKKRDEKASEIEKMKEVKAIYKSIEEYEALLGKAKKDILSLTNQKDTIESLIKDNATNFSKIKDEYDALGNVSQLDVKTEKAKLTEELDQFTVNLNQSNKKLQSVIDDLAYTDAELKHIENDSVSIQEGICDRCKQPVSKEHIDELHADITQKKDALLKNRKSFEKIKGTVQKEIESFSASIMKCQESIKELTNKSDKYTDLQKRMADAENSYTSTNNKLVADLKNANTLVVNAQVTVDEHTAKIQELRQQLPQNMNIDVNLLAQELDALNRSLEDLTIKQGRLQKFEEDIETQKNVLSDKKNILKKLQENLYYFQVLGEAFKDIPAELFKDSILEVESYANEIIRSIYQKFRIKIYEDETKKNRPLMIAFEVDGKYRNYKLLSGGQQSICAIGLRMGFNKILSQRSKVSLNFLILDEIFGALDKFNREEVLRMLNGLTKFFPQILVITHTEEDSIFPNLIKVRMDGFGNSYII